MSKLKQEPKLLSAYNIECLLLARIDSKPDHIEIQTNNGKARFLDTDWRGDFSKINDANYYGRKNGKICGSIKYHDESEQYFDLTVENGFITDLEIEKLSVEL